MRRSSGFKFCDLKNRDIYLYNFHNFEDLVKLKLREELKKGAHTYAIQSLFPFEPFAQRRFKAARVMEMLYEKATQTGLEGPNGALAYYRELQSPGTASPRYVVTEWQLNSLGYRLLRAEHLAAAIAIFELNAAEHPESANTYDSLGEAYLENGQKDLAIANYRRSLALDPTNQNARDVLQRIE